MKKKRRQSFNPRIVLIVTMLCIASLALFFLFWQPPQPADPIEVTSVGEPDDFNERAYYNSEADAFLQTLPEDKVPLLRLIDDSNHCVFYFERGEAPSCYIYDLDRHSTSVLFGGERGFYCDTKLLIVGAIEEWKLVGDLIIFVARNRAPENNYTNATVVFYTNIYTRQLVFVDYGANAFFPDDSHVVVNHAMLLYPGFFGEEDHYTVSPVSYRLI